MTTQTPTVGSTNQLGESCFDDQGVQSCAGGDHAEWKIVPGTLYRRSCLHCADVPEHAVLSRAVGGARRARGRAPVNRAPDRRASAQLGTSANRLEMLPFRFSGGQVWGLGPLTMIRQSRLIDYSDRRHLIIEQRNC